MWIKQIKKKNSEKGKTFYQYQLTETFRVDGTVKHKSVLYLGSNKLLRDKDNKQKLSKMLESRIRETPMLSEEMLSPSPELIFLADEYYEKYLLKIGKSDKEQIPEPKEDSIEYDLINTASTSVFDCREIGAEWMSYEMLERIGLRDFLKGLGWNKKWTDYAMISIISRAVASYSEHKTEQWLKQNSALLELFGTELGTVTRHHLYKAARKLYGIKDRLELFFYNRLMNIFDIKEKIIIYDLTNTYFEGRKDGSKIAQFGKSKEKRYDCKQVVLAAVVNEQGFLKHSRIYEGNMSDPATLEDIITQLQKKGYGNGKQIVVMDAGIAVEENLTMLREKGLFYVCVSRSKLKDYESIDIKNPTIIKDTKGSEIKLRIIDNKDAPDTWMYAKSDGKTKKENSMLEKSIQRFELELESVRKGISTKNGIKKIEKVWERIGRIKERNKRAHKYFQIEIKSENEKATEISWQRTQDIEEKARTGIYFIRTNCPVENETALWEIYNTIREVEDTFRCLKTDLNLRPVYHKSDKHTEAHLHLGLLAYNIVSPIKYMLKNKGINLGWTNIVRIMNTQKVVSVKQKSKDNKEIIIKTCSRPCKDALKIYQTLKISSMPFRVKKFVVHH